MPKQNPDVTLRTWGLYSQWDSAARALPDFVESTTRIPAEIDIEFGMVINIRGGKNLQLDFCIDHPGILDDQGRRRAPFRGVEYVKDNDWDFYLGDTIWAPIEDKLGTWTMTIELQQQIVAEKSFLVVRPGAEPDSAPKRLRHQYRLIWIDGI